MRRSLTGIVPKNPSPSLGFVILVWVLLWPFRTNAQIDSTRSDRVIRDPIAHADSSADVWDVYYRFINRKKGRPQERLESGFHPSIFPELAYALQTGFAVGINANLSFTSRNPEQNISTIITTPQYTQFDQIIIPVVANLWTKGNRYNIVSDFRYFDYSANNFGLGPYSPSETDDLLQYSYLRFYQSVLRQVLPNFSVGLGYALDYHWHIQEDNKTPDLNDDFQHYESTAKTVSSGLMVNALYTNRRNSNNPEASFYSSITYRPNLQILGSDHNWQSVITDVRKYINLPRNSTNILAFWNMNWLSLGGQAPYLDLPSTDWDTYSNLGRGYVQGRFRGRNLIYAETEYRMKVLNNGLVGAVVFANMQAYSDYPTNAFDRLLPGGGVGLRVKVNKHSNLNFAFDYAFGIGGSNGLFLNLGEVF